MIINRRIPKILLSHKATYIGMVILIVLSTACYLGFKTPTQELTQGVKDNRAVCKLEDANFTLALPLEDPAIEKYEEKYSLTLQKCPYIERTNGYGKAVLKLFPEPEKLNLPALYDGSYLSGDSEIMVDRYFFQAQNLSFGDVISIFGKEFTVKGIFTTPDYLLATRLETNFMADGGKFGLVLMTPEAYKALPQDNVKANYSVKFASDNEKEFRKELAKTNYVLSWEPKATNYRIATFDGENEAIVILSVAAPFFLLLVSTAVLAVVLSRLLKKEYCYIGTLTALGYKKREILAHYLRIPALISLVGSLLGLVLGNFLLDPFSLVTSTEYNVPKVEFSIHAADIALVLLVPLTLNLLATAFAVMRAFRRSIVHLLKSDTAKEKRGLLTTLIPYRKGSFKLRFRLKESTANLPRSFLMLIGILASSMFMLTGFLLYSAVDFLFDSNFSALFGYQYQYVFNTIQKEKADVGEPYMLASFSYEKDGSPINFTVHGSADHSKYFHLKDDAGNKIDQSKTVATRSAARRLGLKKGDAVWVESNATLEKKRIVIDEICDIRYSDYIYMPMSKLNSLLNLPAESHIGVYSGEPIDVDSALVSAKLTAEDSKAGIQTSIAAFRAFLYILGAFSAVISLIVVYIVTMMLIEENRKNISLLKVLGYQIREISRLLLNSTSVLVWLGFLVAIPVTLKVVGLFLDYLTKNMFFDFSTKLIWWQGGISFALIVGVYYLTLLLSKRKLLQVNMAESLKANE